MTSAQTQRKLRIHQRRSLNTLDPGNRTNLRDAAILATEGAEPWSEPYFVQGYDEVTFLVEMTKGSADGFRIAAQYSFSQSTDATQWYDLYEDAGAGLLARKVWALDPAGNVLVAFTVRVSAPWVRFKMWGTGSSLVGSSGTLYTTRHMLA